LNSYRDFVAWGRRLEVINGEECAVLLSKGIGSPSAAQRELIHARKLREALHRIFLTESDESCVRDEDLALLNSVVHRARSQRKLVIVASAIEWRQAVGVNLATITHRVGWLAAELLTSRHERRGVRACHGPNCGWLFLDHSRNGHRRWCSDNTCGSHARVRKFRATRSG
jgi:predicted RNA-binding Zn ribbon-like protein